MWDVADILSWNCYVCIVFCNFRMSLILYQTNCDPYDGFSIQHVLLLFSGFNSYTSLTILQTEKVMGVKICLYALVGTCNSVWLFLLCSIRSFWPVLCSQQELRRGDMQAVMLEYCLHSCWWDVIGGGNYSSVISFFIFCNHQ